MSSYNVSKREAKKYGIERVRIGDSKKSKNKDKTSRKKSRYEAKISDTNKEIQNYRTRLLEALKPSQQETDVSNQIANVEKSRDTGIQEIKEQPIEMTPILGQARNVEQRAALELGTLEERLARLQQERQANLNTISTALGFAGEDRSYYTNRADYQDQLAAQMRDYKLRNKQFEASKSAQDRAFNEGTRQFNLNYDLASRKEARIGSGGGSRNGGFDPKDKPTVQKYIYEAVSAGESWPDIVKTMGAVGVDIEFVDDVLKTIFGYK